MRKFWLATSTVLALSLSAAFAAPEKEAPAAVSYTHLTLPTIYSV